MPTVHDVSAYILQKLGPMTTMKLQKLCYYAQAWSLVWDEEPLFNERIEAWANGPVAPALYDCHRGAFKIGPGNLPGNPDVFAQPQRETLDIVLANYGDKSSQWLIDLTHMEAPWRDARNGIPDGVPGQREITPAAMAEYYSSLAG
jgi:uncharacterized phage-associated protein